jgi:hypothetical protein
MKCARRRTAFSAASPSSPRKSTLDDGEKLGWNERVTRAGTPSSPGGDGDRPVQADHFPTRKESRFRLAGQQQWPMSRGFYEGPRRVCSSEACQGVARRRCASRVPQMCPECVRAFNGQTTTKCRFAGTLPKPSDGLEPSTPSLPWKFESVTRVHAWSFATQFLLQIGMKRRSRRRREASRVSFLMCPFCVRALMPTEATP